MSKKKVLCTGSNGFVPSYVIGELHDKGYYVVGLQRSQRVVDGVTQREIPDEIYYGDVRDEALMHKLVEQVDGVIHLAAILGTGHTENVWLWYENNVKGTLNILDACEEAHVPMTYITVGNYFEHNNYSNSKVAAAREVLKYAKFRGVKAGLVRALNAVGPRQKIKNTGKIMATFINNALNDIPLKVFGGKDNCSNMDLVYAGDVAKALVKMLEGIMSGEIAPGTEVEAGTGIAPSVYEIAEMVIKKVGKGTIEEVPMRPGETPKSTVVAEHPFDIGGYMGIDEMIERTVEFYKKYAQ